MTISPSFRDILWAAVNGARGWFLAVLGVGCGLIALGYLTDSSSIERAYAYALLMPFWLAALMGTISIWSYRSRQGIPALSQAGRLTIAAAATWNCLMLYIVSGLEQILTRTHILPRPPRDVLEAAVGPLVAGVAFAILVAVPRGR